MATRAEMLQKMLDANPDDSFARYALSMELAKAGDLEGALDGYTTIISRTPDYVPAYQMAGQLLIEEGRFDEAKERLETGISVAEAAGNKKAQDEMGDLLEEVEMSL